MIDYIFWNYFAPGLHLVTFVKRKDRKMTSFQISDEFSLGQLRRIGA